MRLIAISLFVMLSLSAQDKGDKAKGGGQQSNLKVLKIQNRSEIRPIMQGFATGLGVQCNYCHVQGNFAADDNPKKNVARQMITMVDGLNVGFNAAMGDTKAHITCFTCHRGAEEPLTAPPAAQ